MDSPVPSDNSFRLGQPHSHTAIFATTGSGKSELVSRKILEELQKKTQQIQN